MNLMTTGFMLFSFGVFMAHPIQASSSEESIEEIALEDTSKRLRTFFRNFNPKSLNTASYKEEKKDIPLAILRMLFKSEPNRYDTGTKPIRINFPMKKGRIKQKDLKTVTFLSQNVRSVNDIVEGSTVRFIEAYKKEAVSHSGITAELEHYAFSFILPESVGGTEEERSNGFDIIKWKKKGKEQLGEEDQKSFQPHFHRPNSKSEIDLFGQFQETVRKPKRRNVHQKKKTFSRANSRGDLRPSKEKRKPVILRNESDFGNLIEENVTVQAEQREPSGGRGNKRSKGLKKAKSQSTIKNYSLENQVLIEKARSDKRRFLGEEPAITFSFSDDDDITLLSSLEEFSFPSEHEYFVLRNKDRKSQNPSIINNTDLPRIGRIYANRKNK
ncbi:MAG: hypothetical protein GW748_04690 [Alphaproteobacteria bacterium]|nr:hypothetical protein [Alphaproteobacteria bacterium]NCQ67022.1 hypothetical protein [Alphaproteobacteria bacterium]